MSDPYSILGLSVSTTLDDVNKAYRTLALRYHPDKNPGNQEEANQAMIRINSARERLTHQLSEASPAASTSNFTAAGIAKDHGFNRTRQERSSPTSPQPQPSPTPSRMIQPLTDAGFILSLCVKRTAALIQFSQDRDDLFKLTVHEDLSLIRKYIWKISGRLKRHLKTLQELTGTYSGSVEVIDNLVECAPLVIAVVKNLEGWVEWFKRHPTADPVIFAGIVARSLDHVRRLAKRDH